MPRHFLIPELLAQRDKRESSRVQDPVGIDIADSATSPRIGQRALKSMVSRSQAIREGLHRHSDDLEAPWVESGMCDEACRFEPAGFQ